MLDDHLRLVVLCYTRKSEFIEKYYPYCFKVKEDLYDPEKVLAVCHGRQKTHKGRKFEFASRIDQINYAMSQRNREER